MIFDLLRNYQIFHPHAVGEMNRVKSLGTRFVHYTSAESALKIIKSGEIWLRKSSVMNDFMEVEHGGACLRAAYRGDAGQRFRLAIDKIHNGISSDVQGHFDNMWPYLQTSTYLVSFSEHDDSEDRMGRLSMWRAYGNGNGVALVMNNAVFFQPTDALQAYTSPVAYLGVDGFKAEFEKVTDAINNNSAFLQHYTRQELTGVILNAFKFAVLCTKHPGFKEEREWRVVYTPKDAVSRFIKEELVTIQGVPQIVQKVPLKNIPEENLIGLEPKELFNRVIIGPVNHPLAMHEAFVEALRAANVPRPEEKVIVSDIPIRK